MSDQSTTNTTDTKKTPLKYKTEEIVDNRQRALGEGEGKLSSTQLDSIRNYGYQEEVSGDAGDWFGNLLTTDYFWNYNREPAPSFNFFLRIEGVFDAPCRAVRAFTKENEFEEIQEGGRNDYVILKRKPNTRRFTLQVERYVGIDKIDPLQLGTEMILPMLLAVSRVSSTSAGFADTMSETEFIRFYAFTGCIVTGKEYGELNAEQSGLLKEIDTIAYREMIAITTPNADMVNKPWDITQPTKDRRSAEINRDWDEWRATPKIWDPHHPKGSPDPKAEQSTDENGQPVEAPLIDTRSAGRPVSDQTKAKPKLWGGPDRNTYKTDRSAVPNQSDDTKAETKLWGGVDTDNRDFKRNKNATPNKYDNTKAAKKSWKVKKNGDKANRSADLPKQDEKRAKIKSWNVDPTRTRQSKAAKPTGDKRHAKNRMFNVKKPDKFKFAKAPAGDTEKSAVDGYDIEKKSGARANTPGGDKARAARSSFTVSKDASEMAKNKKANAPEADAARNTTKSFNIKSPKDVRLSSRPSKDETKAQVKGYTIKTKSGNVAAKPGKDSERAQKSTFNIKRKNLYKKAKAPESDSKRNPVKGYNIKKKGASISAKAAKKKWDTKQPGLNRSAVIPPQDSKKATPKMWDFRNPTANRSAVTIKGAAEVAKFLSGKK